MNIKEAIEKINSVSNEEALDLTKILLEDRKLFESLPVDSVFNLAKKYVAGVKKFEGSKCHRQENSEATRYAVQVRSMHTGIQHLIVFDSKDKAEKAYDLFNKLERVGAKDEYDDLAETLFDLVNRFSIDDIEIDYKYVENLPKYKDIVIVNFGKNKPDTYEVSCVTPKGEPKENKDLIEDIQVVEMAGKEFVIMNEDGKLLSYIDENEVDFIDSIDDEDGGYAKAVKFETEEDAHQSLLNIFETEEEIPEDIHIVSVDEAFAFLD